MLNKEISFSCDNGIIRRKDIDETSKMTEAYFGTEKDPNQISTTPQNKDWIYKNIPKYLNIIKKGKEIIGYAFLLPCNRNLMEDFINNKINESSLLESIKKIKLH